MDLACTKIKEAWAKAAAGSTSNLFAAWLTTAAVNCLRNRFEYGSFSVSLNANNHRALCEKYAAFLGIDNEGGRIAQLLARDSAQGGVFSSGHGLFCPAEAIIRGASAQSEENTQAAVIFEKPEDFITVKYAQMTERQYGAESVLMDRVLDSMKRRLLASEGIRSEFLCSMNPLIKDIREIYRPKDSSNGPNASITTIVVFGLQLLVESYKSFMLSDQTAPKIVNCRIQMLKFAQDVKNTLTKIRTSRPFIHNKCCDYFCSSRDLSSEIWTFELDLMVLTEQRIFDLYYQAPWVAGSQMLEILSRATLFGVRLCNRRPIVWAVLHLYNLLRQCGALDKETVLLEHLCSAIGKQVFRGEPPQRDFWTRYKVCNGGRIEFDRSKRHQTRREHSPSDEGKPCSRSGRNWRLTMPNQHTVNTNDNHEINPHQTSVFAGLHKCRFRPSCCAWSYVWHGTDRTKYPTDEHVQQVAGEIAAHPFVFALDHLESAVGPELQGSFPMARLNWFEIFLTVTEILSEMGKTAHVECVECRNSAANAEFWVAGGRFAVEQILQRADAYECSGMSEFRSKTMHMVERAGNAIRGAVRGKGFIPDPKVPRWTTRLTDSRGGVRQENERLRLGRVMRSARCLSTVPSEFWSWASMVHGVGSGDVAFVGSRISWRENQTELHMKPEKGWSFG